MSGPERDFYELLGAPRGAVLAPARVLGEVELDALEAAWGTSRSVRVGREEPCAACAGSGHAPGHEVGVCRTCAGRGTIRVSPALRRGRWLRVDPCGACGGDGRVRLPCPECDGKGTTTRERTITVRIAPGVEDGAQLRVAGGPESSHLLIRVLPRPESRLIRYAAAALLALALAFLVFLLQMG